MGWVYSIYGREENPYKNIYEYLKERAYLEHLSYTGMQY
jgi:hypothetical protein